MSAAKNAAHLAERSKRADQRFVGATTNCLAFGAGLFWVGLLGWTWSFACLGVLAALSVILGAYAFGLFTASDSSSSDAPAGCSRTTR